MNIAMFSPSWPAHIACNGIVTSVAILSEELERQGHKVFIVTHKILDHDHSDRVILLEHGRRRDFFGRLFGYIVDRLYPKYWHNMFSEKIIQLVDDLVKKYDVEIFEIEESFGWNLGVTKNLEIPVVVRLHGPWFLQGGFIQNFKKPMPTAEDSTRCLREIQALRSAFAIASPARLTLKKTLEQIGTAPEITRVIPPPTTDIPAEERWSLSGCEKNSILFVGRFDRTKGGDIALTAFQQVLESFPQARLVFVGPDNGIVMGENQLMHWQEYIGAKIPGSVRARIEYLGKTPLEKIPELRRKCFVTLVCSRMENFPNIVLEAQAYGCPLVATDVGGIPEIVRHYVTGILTSPGDPSAMASAICQMMNDPERAAKMGNKAWQETQARFNPEIIAQQTIEFYDEVIAKKKFQAQ